MKKIFVKAAVSVKHKTSVCFSFLQPSAVSKIGLRSLAESVCEDCCTKALFLLPHQSGKVTSTHDDIMCIPVIV